MKAKLQAMADYSYCEYIRLLSTPDCLGWEYKVDNKQFGKQQLDAHCKASVLLGMHKAYAEAARMCDE